MLAPLIRLSTAACLAAALLSVVGPGHAADPKPTADEAKANKPAKAPEAEESKSVKSIKPTDLAKHAEAPKADAGRPGDAGKRAESAKPAAGKGSTLSKDDAEAARLEELSTKIAEKLAKAKTAGASPGALVIRVKAPERPHAPSGHAAPIKPVAHTRPAAELHPLVLAASQREAAHAAPGAPSAGAPGKDGHASHGHGAHWSYSGETGPANWARLRPEFAKCAEGTRQSPINIRGGIKVDLEPITFEYRPTPFSVIDNGHTVQVNMDPGNQITVMGRRYELLQFHFHRPAEERVDGKVFDMVAHLVHKDTEGRLAVIAVLMDRGQAHPLIQAVWNNLPLERGEELPGTVTLDLNGLLPTNKTYFTYMGSLTTPPCSEGVLWMVMKEPVTVSPEQIAIFSRLYPMNARPLQALSNRLIKESN